MLSRVEIQPGPIPGCLRKLLLITPTRFIGLSAYLFFLSLSFPPSVNLLRDRREIILVTSYYSDVDRFSRYHVGPSYLEKLLYILYISRFIEHSANEI